MPEGAGLPSLTPAGSAILQFFIGGRGGGIRMKRTERIAITRHLHDSYGTAIHFNVGAQG